MSTLPRLLATFAEERAISADILLRHGLGWSRALSCFTLPIRDASGRVVDLRRKPTGGGKGKSWPGGKTFPFGYFDAVRDSRPGPVYLCAGEWDALALLERAPDRFVCGVPGEGTFKPEWVALLKTLGHEVIITYDLDDAGREGAKMTAGKLAAAGVVVHLRNLPAELGKLEALNGKPAKDLRDFFTLAGRTLEDYDALPLEEQAPGDVEATATHRPTGAGHETEFGTDLDLARRLVLAHGHSLRFCWEHGRWYYWDGRRWRPDLGARVTTLAKRVVLELRREASDGLALATSREAREVAEANLRRAIAAQGEKRIEAMIRLARSEPGIPVGPDQLDSDPWLLTCRNGTIELRSGDLRPHNPADLLTKLAPVEYSSDARCPRWLAFLERIFNSNSRLIDFVQRAAGYALTGDTSEQVLFFFYGGGKNGKSTLLNSLLSALGDYGRQSAPELLVLKQHESHPTEIADLAGARFVATIEVGEGKRMAETLVKQMTGQDRMKARFMRQDFFEFEPTHKLFLAANHKPNIRGTDEAIWRRILMVPFTVTIPEEERDRSLPEKLRHELPGILAWAVRGSLAWQREGLRPPAEVLIATADYRQESDTVGAFIAECLEVRASGWETSASVQAAALKWCEANGEREITIRTLRDRLRELGFEPDKGAKGQRRWLGVELRAEWRPEWRDNRHPEDGEI
ncbi:MAG: DNA primase [Candidatus Wallbacteria bacterium]|nr:DNA primase [Candidatus Wallbacteria bacterium]